MRALIFVLASYWLAAVAWFGVAVALEASGVHQVSVGSFMIAFGAIWLVVAWVMLRRKRRRDE
jgi:hypothetical protein